MSRWEGVRVSYCLQVPDLSPGECKWAAECIARQSCSPNEGGAFFGFCHHPIGQHTMNRIAMAAMGASARSARLDCSRPSSARVQVRTRTQFRVLPGSFIKRTEYWARVITPPQCRELGWHKRRTFDAGRWKRTARRWNKQPFWVRKTFACWPGYCSNSEATVLICIWASVLMCQSTRIYCLMSET